MNECNNVDDINNPTYDMKMYWVCSCGETYPCFDDVKRLGDCRRCRNPDLRLEHIGEIKPWIFKQFKTHEEYMMDGKWPESFV